VSAKGEIVSHYWVRARLDGSFHPVRKELFDMDLCSTIEEAEKALDAIKRHGGYCEAEIRRFDVRFVNGRSTGAVNLLGEVEKRWKRKEAGNGR
jgi:hypothetical protein